MRPTIPRTLRTRRRARSPRRFTPEAALLEERTLLSITIQLDYSLDANNFFKTQAKRDLMQLAANALADDFNDSLTAIVPAGGDTWGASFPSPATGATQTIANLYVPANTVIVYVGGRALPGQGEAGDGTTGGFSVNGDTNWVNNVAARGQSGALLTTPKDFGPWGGSIGFDNAMTNWYFGTDASGLQPDQSDFLTVAEHELAHVLGFGTSDSWDGWINAGAFTGPASEAAHGGAPVPVSPDQGHWAEGTMSDGHPTAMEPVLFDGTRNLFTTLDYAGLADVGWQFTPPVVQFAAPNASIAENAGSLTVTVNRTGGGEAPFTVNYATADGSAQAGLDYAATSGTLSFGVGVNSETFSVPLLYNSHANGNETFSVKLTTPTAGAVVGTPASATVSIDAVSGASALLAPVLSASDDTGVSSSDGITRNNGTPQAPLIFTVSGVSPANGYVRLLDVTGTPVVLAGPTQAVNGTVSFILASTPLGDGVHEIAATAALSVNGTQSDISPSTPVSIQSSLTITGTNPAQNALVTALPGGGVTITFSHPLAGLTDGGPALGPNDPYAVFLLQRGPGLGFSAPSGIDSGNLPLHANTVYHVNADGTSSITITPLEPLSTDVYAISVDLADFSDLAGNPLTDPLGAVPGYRSFLLQPPPITTAPLQVLGVTTYNGFTTVNNGPIFQPDTFAIAFNKALWQGDANSTTFQIVANPGPNFTIVPSVATYSPTTDTVYLTPTGRLLPGTAYTIRVDASVSDDQGFSGPGPGTLGTTFYDGFSVINPPVGAGVSPLRVAQDPNTGSPEVFPSNNSVRTQPLGYAAVQFTEPLNLSPTVFGRYSAMLDPRTEGSDGNAALANIPLNAKLAFNPNTDQLVIVPTQAVGNDLYVISLSNLQSQTGDPLLNSAGQVAGISGPPFFASFLLQVSGASAVSATRAAALFTAPTDPPQSHPIPTTWPATAPVVVTIGQGRARNRPNVLTANRADDPFRVTIES